MQSRQLLGAFGILRVPKALLQRIAGARLVARFERTRLSYVQSTYCNMADMMTCINSVLTCHIMSHHVTAHLVSAGIISHPCMPLDGRRALQQPRGPHSALGWSVAFGAHCNSVIQWVVPNAAVWSCHPCLVIFELYLINSYHLSFYLLLVYPKNRSEDLLHIGSNILCFLP